MTTDFAYIKNLLNCHRQVGRAVKAPDLRSGLHYGVVSSILTPGNEGEDVESENLFKYLRVGIILRVIKVFVRDSGAYAPIIDK